MKILVIALSGIGDCIIATPFIHELRANFPEAAIHALVHWPGAKDLLDDNPHLDAVHQKNLIKAGTVEALRYFRSLSRERYDVSINVHTQGRIHYRVAARIIGAPVRVSHRYETSPLLDRFLVNRMIPEDYAVHCVENNNRLLGLLGRKPVLPAHEYEVFLLPEEKSWAEEFLARNGLTARRRVGFHVGSGGTKNLALKRWPLEHYIELLQRFTTSHPEVAVLLFGGPEEREAHARITEATRGRLVFQPQTRNLRQAAALMQHCHAFVSVDTALMCLAAAMKVPNQVVIEAPTLNATNLPWKTNYRVIRNPAVAGRNLEFYRYNGRPIKGTAEELKRIMASVPVDDVYAALVGAL